MPICLYEKAVSRRIPAGSTRHIWGSDSGSKGLSLCALLYLVDLKRHECIIF